MKTFNVTYCCVPFIFVMNGTVTRSTRPVVDCGFKLNCGREIVATRHVTLLATIIYNIITAITFAICPCLLINLFVDLSDRTTGVTVRNFPCFTDNFIFFVIGVTIMNCFRDIREVGPTAVFTLLHNFIFLVPDFVLLPGFLNISKV